jgi:hypothetical protein
MNHKYCASIGWGIFGIFLSSSTGQEAYPYRPSQFCQKFQRVSALIDANRCAEAQKMIVSETAAIEKDALIWTKRLTEFPQVPNEADEMNAYANFLLLKGKSLEKEKKTDDAKAVFETIWRKYPFALIWMSPTEMKQPAKEAYLAWQTLVWIDALRNQEVDEEPFDSGASFYHSRSGNIALDAAAKIVVKTDGYRPIEFAFARMSSSNYYKSVFGSKSVSALFQALSDAGDEAPESEWVSLQGRLEKWSNDNPDNAVAKITLATFWLNYAWYARGSGWASSVGDEGWKKFHERVLLAAKLLLKTPQDHPEWFRAMLTAMLAGITDRSMVDQVFQRGETMFPTYYPIYSAMRHYLMPRWHGSPGEWEGFAKAMALKHGTELYVYLCDEAEDYDGEEGLEKNPAVEWAILKDGYEKAIQARPNSWGLASQYAFKSCRRLDKAAAKSAFETRAAAYHPIVWGPKIQFGRAIIWATSEN